MPLSLDDGLRVAARYVDYYKTVHPHSAIGYVTPQTPLEGRQQAIFDARDKKLDASAHPARCPSPPTFRSAGRYCLIALADTPVHAEPGH